MEGNEVFTAKVIYRNVLKIGRASGNHVNGFKLLMNRC